MILLSLFIANAFADTAAAPVTTPPQPGMMSMLLPFGLMFLVFYFLLIRPQQKKQKQHEEMLNTLQKGEEVVTASGIFGKVSDVADKIITLEVAPNVKIRVLKSQVATIQREAAAKA